MNIRFMAAVFAALMLACTACGVPTTTITNQPGNHKYGVNETIDIVDIDSRDTLGTLTMKGFHLLKDAPFELQKPNGTDEDGNNLYKSVTYQQLVQIYYVYTVSDSSDSITASHFTTQDSAGIAAVRDPAIEYEPVAKKDMKSYVVALKNRSEYVDIEFNFISIQSTPTARIRLSIT